jgi:hypothetical protein
MGEWSFEQAGLNLGGRTLKAGLHCHSNNSDGGLSPEDTILRYRELGYHIVGLTDHRIVTPVSHLSGPGFLALNSIEVGVSPDVIGIRASSPPDSGGTLGEATRALALQGAFTIAAHPSYCASIPADYLECGGLMALEIYNAYCEEAYANGTATEIWDMLLSRGMRVFGTASDDAHLNPRKRYYSDAGRAWVEVWEGEVSEPAVIGALKEGRYYSTQGPVFETISVGERAVSLECSPVSRVRWRSRGSRGFVQYAQGEAVTAAVMPSGFEPRGYLRIEIIDDHGRRAWSNPFFVK